MRTDSFCLFMMPDGTVTCASCDHLPTNSVYKSAAPEGLPEGNYQSDDPRLVDTQSEVSPEGGPEV